MSASAGLAAAGVTAQRGVATTTVFLDDITFPVMNVSHTAQGGSIALSAGTNPSQGFSVQQTQVGNSQVFAGPNILVSNVLQVPQTAVIGTANVSNALNVTGPSMLTGNTVVTGSFQTTGSTIIGNVLQVGNVTNTPILHSNVITTSAFTATGPLANAYVETVSNSSSTTAALYLSANWRVKVISSGGLAFQYLLGGTTWTNAQVLAPPNLSISIASLTTPTT